MNKQWVTRFRTMGKLQLRALTHYRTIEDARQDKSEGLKITSVTSGNFDREQCKEFFGIDIVEGLAIGHDHLEPSLEQRTNVVTGKFTVNLELPTGYLMCASTTNTANLMNRFCCDDFFAITDPNRFANVVAQKIGSSLNAKVEFSHRLVTYVSDKTIEIPGAEVLRSNGAFRYVTVDDYFVKTADYEIEAEYRFVFCVAPTTRTDRIEIRLTPEELRTCCSFAKIPDA